MPRLRTKKDCLLCQAEEKTKRHADEEDWWCADCERCGVPMFVWRSHKFPTLTQQRRLINLAKAMFPKGVLDMARRSIPDHYHFHVR